MKGGPSHVDTFDPKPLLQRDDGKPYPYKQPRVQFAETGKLLRSPWSFKQHGQSGLPVSELFPNVAECADGLCILRSVHGTNPAHGGACLKLHTGSDTQIRPSMGSWLLYGLGSENENLPGFITICPTFAHGGAVNRLGGRVPACVLPGNPNRERPAVPQTRHWCTTLLNAESGNKLIAAQTGVDFMAKAGPRVHGTMRP
jgi:hypothetical protein